VTMKALGEEQEQSASQQDKKIRVISRREVIECQPKQQQGHQQQQKQQPKKLQCTINGQTVKPHQEQQSEERQQQLVEYNNEDQSSVTITVPGVQVRFNGKKAWIKLSKLYQNQQCGLCGHYDGDSDNDLRMGDNEQTSDVEQFHRSFSLPDNAECSTTEQDNFYSSHKQKGAFRRVRASSSEQQEGEQRSQEERDEEEMSDDGWWGPSAKQAVWKREQQQDSRRRQNTEPVKRTKVVETHQEICFSVEPIKLCPAGTTPAEQGSQEQQQRNTRKVPFFCLERSSSEARRLQRQARSGEVVSANGRAPDFTRDVRVPGKCIRY
jgi:hypothetical protein